MELPPSPLEKKTINPKMEHKSYFKVKCLFKLNTFDLSLVITLLKCPQFGPKMADGV